MNESTQTKRFAVKRTEIAAWLQVVVAIAGLLITLNLGGPAFDALQNLGDGSLPDEFVGAQGFLKAFLLLLVIVVLLGLLFVGLGVALGGLFRACGARSPLHAAFSFIAFLVLVTLAACSAIFLFPMMPLLGLLALSSLFLCAYSTQAEAGGEEGGFYSAGLVLGVLSIAAGGVAALFASIPVATRTTGADTVDVVTAQDASGPVEANGAP